MTLGGTVTTTLAVVAADTTAAAALDLTAAGPTIVKVSVITLTTNNDQGLTLTATPTDLTKTGGQAITVQVTSVPADDPAPTVFVAGEYQIGSTTAVTLLKKDLYIKYSPGTTQDPGLYAGSIDLLVEDK